MCTWRWLESWELAVYKVAAAEGSWARLNRLTMENTIVQSTASYLIKNDGSQPVVQDLLVNHNPIFDGSQNW